MIKIGLTGWSDHPLLYNNTTTSRDKLFDYSAHFPIVEVDTSFYAIPSVSTVEKWVKETPDDFQFVVKAYQGMTGHLRDENPFSSRQEMFDSFKASLEVFQKAGKLAFVLVQFPPWFDCQTKNVQYIRFVKQQLQDFPVAIEFRNQTWYLNERQQQTMEFLKNEQLIHTICDEPQAGIGSVPFVPSVTSNKAFIRIHGRNVYGWRNTGSAEHWRKVRFLYDYNEEELTALAKDIKNVELEAKEVYVLFNNNSGHHAAKNAFTLQQILGLQFDGLAPKQLDLFGEMD